MDDNLSKKDSGEWNTKLVAWFLRNTQLVVLVFIFILAGGVISLLSLRSEGFPSPEINIAIITGTYRGASPGEVEKQITKPIETAVQSLNGVKEYRSTSSNSFSVTTVSFEAGTDFKASLSELRNKVQNVELPKDADKPEISVPNIGGNSSVYAVAGLNGRESLRVPGEKLKQDIEAVPGVKEFKLISDLKDQIIIKWKADALSESGINPLQIQQALAANNISMPAGTIEVDGRRSSVISVAPINEVNEISNIIVGPRQGTTPPQPVRLGEIAVLERAIASKDLSEVIGYKEAEKEGSVKNIPALVYQMTPKAGADVLKVDEGVQKVIKANLKKPDFTSVKIVPVYNVADDVRQQVEEIKEGAIGGKIGESNFANLGYLLGGIWLVILVMLLFVNLRAAIISATVIPLSMLFTFLALKIQGVTLNTLTLFSLILVLGLVVDPAIVVLEAIQRELDLGKRGKDAVLSAINTIGNGVFIAVLTSIIVFIPFGIVSGIFGEIIRYIPITVIPALLASYFVPLLFLTYFAGRYLKPKKGSGTNNELELIWGIGRWFVQMNRLILSKRWLQVTVIAAAIVIPLGLTGFMFADNLISPVQFSQVKDSPRIQIKTEFADNLTKEQKQKALSNLNNVLNEEGDIMNYLATNQSEGSIYYLINLLPRKMRDGDSENLVARLNKKLSSMTVPEQNIYYNATQIQPGIPASDFPVAVNIYGDNLDSLKKAAIETGNLLRKQAEVTRVEDGFTNEKNPEIQVVLNREKIQQLGLSSIQISQTLSTLLGESTVTKYEEAIDGIIRPVEVILKSQENRINPDQINKMIVAATTMGPVKVAEIAQVGKTDGFAGINRLNGSRYVTVQAQVKDPLKDVNSPQKAVADFWTEEKLAEFNLRADALQDKGSTNEFLQSFQELFNALGIAIVLTYIVLVLFFRSFSQPFIILFAIPLSFLGVFPALYFVGGQFGFLEILGVITLVGIVENVGIFLIDLANRRTQSGTDYRIAIAEATGIRFRPIFLTKVTALGGLLPLIVISPFWRSLAIVVVAGIITSGVLSLFTTPILYVWFRELPLWISRLPKNIRTRSRRSKRIRSAQAL